MLLAIMRKAAMLMLAVIGFTAFASAQTVTGTVTDSKGEPASGISVTVKVQPRVLLPMHWVFIP